jgi:DNA modification methylase
MEVEFYCKDARESFLEPSSVDLFITHLPFFKTLSNEHGGDPNLQIQNADTQEDFSKALVEFLKTMDVALKDDGAILLILPNTRVFFKILSDIVQNTSLVIKRDIIWNFEKSEIVNGVISGNEINHILYIAKSVETTHPISNLDSFVIEADWEVYHVDENLYFDALPKKMIEKLISVFSNEGDTIADLMAGTGTVAISSLKNNRKTIYNDVSADQVDLAKRRIYDTIESERKGQ